MGSVQFLRVSSLVLLLATLSGAWDSLQSSFGLKDFFLLRLRGRSFKLVKPINFQSIACYKDGQGFLVAFRSVMTGVRGKGSDIYR